MLICVDDKLDSELAESTIQLPGEGKCLVIDVRMWQTFSSEDAYQGLEDEGLFKVAQASDSLVVLRGKGSDQRMEVLESILLEDGSDYILLDLPASGGTQCRMTKS